MGMTKEVGSKFAKEMLLLLAFRPLLVCLQKLQ